MVVHLRAGVVASGALVRLGGTAEEVSSRAWRGGAWRPLPSTVVPVVVIVVVVVTIDVHLAVWFLVGLGLMPALAAALAGCSVGWSRAWLHWQWGRRFQLSASSCFCCRCLLGLGHLLAALVVPQERLGS